MNNSLKLQEAFKRFDAANGRDPNTEVFDGETYPKELLYAQRMSATLNAFEPTASVALQLAARSQHIQRWEMPREDYPMDRVGYLKWREELKKFHAQKAAEILTGLAYDEELIERVKFLLLKKKLKKDDESQTLEDVVCLVFLEFYFEPFAKKHSDSKLMEILQKTWKKMSDKGQKTALKLAFSETSKKLIKKALSHGAE